MDYKLRFRTADRRSWSIDSDPRLWTNNTVGDKIAISLKLTHCCFGSWSKHAVCCESNLCLHNFNEITFVAASERGPRSCARLCDWFNRRYQHRCRRGTVQDCGNAFAKAIHVEAGIGLTSFWQRELFMTTAKRLVLTEVFEDSGNTALVRLELHLGPRSEERRVGKEGRVGGAAHDDTRK